MVVKYQDYQALMLFVESLVREGKTFSVKTNYGNYPYHDTVLYYEVKLPQEPQKEME